ncbi:MAG: saccharopine dehydrogenase NADP-binding domain-containing protein [Myxococcota bacterium]
MSEEKFEILLYGATGFTGQLTAEYLDGHPALAGKRWAIAGRNPAKLENVRKKLNSPHVEAVACSLDDADGVEAMVGSTQVLITTAGPYSVYSGDVLLGACARQGVHYSDLSGEGFWQREMVHANHEKAVASGAKIVLGGGVDSIPSDLGAFLALEELGISADSPVKTNITGVYTRYSGSFSGGTLASGAARKKAFETGRLTKADLGNPYLLVPGQQNTREEPTWDGMPRRFRFSFNRKHGALLPFFMGAVNAPVVRRSLALSGLHDQVTYRECCAPEMWLKVLWLYTSRGFGYPLGQPIKFKPEPGEGPPEWMIRQGGFTIEVDAQTAAGQTAAVTIEGEGDPGYGATSKMLAELALCLRDPHPRKPEGGGVLTPATALGHALVDQLKDAQNGRLMKFRVSRTL